MDKTAIERDRDWLIENLFDNVDVDQFSDWVTRMTESMGESRARCFVIKQLLKEREMK